MDKNIVIIGMPGSGKTSLGKKLSEKLNYHFIDMDHYIEESRNRTIASMFEEGEMVFREEEIKASQELADTAQTVISTGGGIITQEASMEALKKNGLTLFLDRPLENIEKDIERDSRPLLKNGKSRLEELYEERIELYHFYADIKVKNTLDENSVVEAMAAAINQYESRVEE